MVDSDWLGGCHERCKRKVARSLGQKSLHLAICIWLSGLLVVIPYLKHETSTSCISCNVCM